MASDHGKLTEPRFRDALIRIGGLDAGGWEGYHNVGDEQEHGKCPGCWAWWGLFGTVNPTQEQLDTLKPVEGIKGYD